MTAELHFHLMASGGGRELWVFQMPKLGRLGSRKLGWFGLASGLLLALEIRGLEGDEVAGGGG